MPPSRPPARPEPLRLPEPAEREAYRLLSFGLRVGEVLLSCGAGTADVEATVLAAVHACGLRRCEVDVTFTSLSIAYLRGDDVAPVVNVRVVRHRGLDYTRLTEVANVVADLEAGRVSQEEATARLDTADRAPHPYRRWTLTLATGALAASIVVLLGGTLVPAVVGFLAAAAVDRLNLWLARRNMPAFYQNVCGGALATSVAVFLFWLHVPVPPSLVIAAGIVVLLPGVVLVGSVQDAISGFLVTAAARSMEVLLLTAGIIGGVGIALNVSLRLGVEIEVLEGGVSLGRLPVAVLAAGLAGVFFAYANYAPRRALPAAGVAAALGYLVVSALQQVEVSAAIAAGAAAVTVGFGSYALAGRQRIPPLVLVVPGIIPLLPGLTIYSAMLRLTQGEPFTGIIILLDALSVGVALAAGVLLGEILAQPVRRELGRWERRYAGPRLVAPLRRVPGGDRMTDGG